MNRKWGKGYEVIVNSCNGKKVANAVLQRSVLGPRLSSTFLNVTLWKKGDEEQDEQVCQYHPVRHASKDVGIQENCARILRDWLRSSWWSSTCWSSKVHRYQKSMP